MSLVLSANVTTALGVLFPVGLAAILRDGPDKSATFRWNDTSAQCLLNTALSGLEVADALRAFASRRSRPESWMSAKGDSESSLFAPRVRAPQNAQAWRTYEEARIEHLASDASLTELDWLWLAGLGEPAWWRWSPRDSRPDDGASRWEMKTRNQGQDMVKHRLLPLVSVVATRPVNVSVDGLFGDGVLDETGSEPAFLTATGLQPPGPVDSSVALCGLVALSQLRVLPRVGAVAATVGLVPRRGVHPKSAFLPVFGAWSSPRRFASIASSKRFDDFCIRLIQLGDEAEMVQIDEWLKEMGLLGVLVCAVDKVGSTSAPERRVLSGRVFV